MDEARHSSEQFLNSYRDGVKIVFEEKKAALLRKQQEKADDEAKKKKENKNRTDREDK